MTQPRLLQVFLSRTGHGVYEVSIALGTRLLTCTCPGFAQRKKCKHVDWVAERLGPEGEYLVVVPQGALELLAAAKDDTKAWRTALCRYTTPEVL